MRLCDGGGPRDNTACARALAHHMSSVESRISGTVTASTTPKAMVLQQWSADMSKRRPREDAGVEQDAQAAAGFGGFGGRPGVRPSRHTRSTDAAAIAVSASGARWSARWASTLNAGRVRWRDGAAF